jgi:hypothetical protein
MKKRIYWWRFFFDTFRIDFHGDDGRILNDHVGWVCRLMLPCADNYRPGKAANENTKLWPMV